MPAKSFLSNMREHLRHFSATTLHGEVSDANIRGYLRAASQIEDVWQQIDDRLATSLAQGIAPWEAYQQLGSPLAFIRAARAHQVFVKALLEADAAADPSTAGYLPQVTYDQADALCHQIQPDLQRAVAALSDPHFVADVALPQVLGPRVEAEGAPCPLAHLQGMIAATREVREWAAGLVAQYHLAVQHAEKPVPASIPTHISTLQGKLAQGDSQLRFGVDLVGQISQGEATSQLHEEAEDSLWSALQTFFLINQAVALPELLSRQSHTTRREVNAPQKQSSYHDRRIHPADLWRIAAPSARNELRGTTFGTDEMEEMCEKMGGVLSAGAQQYLDESEEAKQRDEIYLVSAMANSPFEPLYRARRTLTIADADIPAGYEFHWDFHRGHIEMKSRFTRVSDWQECEE